MLVRMRQLLGDPSPVSQGNILRELLLQRLLLHIGMSLAYASNVSLDELSDITARVAEFGSERFIFVTNSQTSPASNIEKR